MKAEEISWRKFAEELSNSKIALIPVGAVEPHGYHAPLGLDNYVAQEITNRLAQVASCISIPALSYGCCSIIFNTTKWPGSFTIRPEILTELYTDIGKELSRFGAEIVIFINTHACNFPMLQLASEKIYAETGTSVGILEWWKVAKKEIEEIKGFDHGNHGDEIETSLLLATAGEQFVDLKSAEVNDTMLRRLTPGELQMYKQKVHFSHEIDERWVGKAANFGDPTRATKEKGTRIIDQTVSAGLEMIKVLRTLRKSRSFNATG